MRWLSVFGSVGDPVASVNVQPRLPVSCYTKAIGMAEEGRDIF